jgi:hypothetical protein
MRLRKTMNAGTTNSMEIVTIYIYSQVLQINIGFDFIREENSTTNISRQETQLEVQLLYF